MRHEYQESCGGWNGHICAPLIVVLAGLLVAGPVGRALSKSPLPQGDQVDEIFAHPEVAPPQGAIAPAALPPAEWAEYEGQYYSDEIDTVYNVERHGSSISITRPKYPATLLTPDSRDKFTMLGFSVVLSRATVRFTRDAQQHVTGLLIDGDQLFNFKFTKR